MTCRRCSSGCGEGSEVRESAGRCRDEDDCEKKGDILIDCPSSMPLTEEQEMDYAFAPNSSDKPFARNRAEYTISRVKQGFARPRGSHPIPTYFHVSFCIRRVKRKDWHLPSGGLASVRNKAIMAKYQEGCTLIQLGELFGLSYRRIHQIIRHSRQ